MRPADGLAARLGLPVRDPALLEQALVHTSYLHEHPDSVAAHNERLEFLGDSVVNLVVSESLYVRHPDDDEGALSARRAAIVSAAGLARLADRIGLGDALLLGEGEALRSGRRRPSLLASGFEALVGALYLDQGYATTREWLVAVAAPELEADDAIGSLKSPKSRLQEFTQARSGRRPTYRIVAAAGPDHDRLYRIEVLVEEAVLGVGEGSSRRIAETAAAAAALASLTTASTTVATAADPVRSGATKAVPNASSPPSAARSAPPAGQTGTLGAAPPTRRRRAPTAR